MFTNIDLLELDKSDFNNSLIKNTFIRNTDKEFITYINKEETNIDEISDFLYENPLYEEYDIIIFGENVPEYETDFTTFIHHFDMNIFAFTYRRTLMEYTGCFNEKLSAYTNFEFLCRLVKNGRVCCIPCKSEREHFLTEADVSNQATTLAYILKYNLQELQAANQLNTIFSEITTYMTSHNALTFFNDRLSKFLNSDEEYRAIERNTAPFYIIMIEDACYGVVLDFALSLSKELQRFGQSVVTNKDKYGITVPLEKIGIINWKAVIGFQAPFLENPILQKLNSPKIQYWFDNPAFFYKTLFNYSGDDYYVLCHDKFYINYLKKYYHIKNAMLCPPAGKGELYFEAENKIYDIVFVGSFKLNRMPTVTDDFIKQFYSYMIDNPTLTYEEGLNHILQDNPILQDEEQFKELHSSLASLCHIISGHYRTKVIETLINANIQIHVFGESWKLYDGEFKDNLIIHPDVSVEESLKVMSQAKISLNVMHWHKAGMTERIANSMLTGAVCVSDETTYLKENFTEDEIVLYELNHLDELPAKINKILSDDDYRRKLVHNAYSKAIKEHTWRQRAEKILELTR